MKPEHLWKLSHLEFHISVSLFLTPQRREITYPRAEAPNLTHFTSVKIVYMSHVTVEDTADSFRT